MSSLLFRFAGCPHPFAATERGTVERTGWFVAVPTQHGWIKRSTGTSHKPTALQIERMLVVLGPKGRRTWSLLERVANGSLNVAALYDAHSRDDLNGLRRRMRDVDLEPHVATWLKRLEGRNRKPDTLQYQYMIHTLLPKGKVFFRSRFTFDGLDARLAAYPAGPSTRRKAHVAMSVFARHLAARS